MGRRRTKQEQQREVAGFRKSGQGAAAYAASRGYSTSTLLRWNAEQRLNMEPRAPGFVRLHVEPSGPPPGELVVEIGAVRVRVVRGFDPVLLRDLVAALRVPEAM